MRSTATWRSARPGPCPYKPAGNIFSIVPGGGDPARIKPDIVHTFHIGVGVDMAASIIVWLVKLRKFEGRSFEERLRDAYSKFMVFCHDSNRYTSCNEWTQKRFGMSQYLDFDMAISLYIVFLKPSCLEVNINSIEGWGMKPRINDYPTSLAGKAQDTGVVCRWLEAFLLGLDLGLKQKSLDLVYTCQATSEK